MVAPDSDLERLELCAPCVLHREIRPPSPRSKATVCAVTRGNIAEIAATAFVALFIVLLSVRTIGYRGEQCSGGEGVSQSPLKDKALSTFVDQNPPFQLRAKMEFRVRKHVRFSTANSARCWLVDSSFILIVPLAEIEHGYKLMARSFATQTSRFRPDRQPPESKTRRRQCLRRASCRGSIVSVVALVVAIVILALIVIVAIVVTVVAATRDDRSTDCIENERTRIRLALEVEHVIERICKPVDGSRTLGRSNRAIDEAELPIVLDEAKHRGLVSQACDR